MKITVTRQACCSQDDQLGPLEIYIDLQEESKIWELARAIGESNFLQFSGSHNILNAFCAGKLLFSIPQIGCHKSTVAYAVGRDDPISIHLAVPEIEFIWPKGL
ncbi:hypothetical protein [Pseudomonas paeninsulae]|uniref:hypothetical protein n=1 Tax=Pseudomonas paeninsulae TaxID=3110772 RepID=UPI002D79AAEB|nr:hypothetical protein [Pseudomonas sp. IT1137]